MRRTGVSKDSTNRELDSIRQRPEPTPALREAYLASEDTETRTAMVATLHLPRGDQARWFAAEQVYR